MRRLAGRSAAPVSRGTSRAGEGSPTRVPRGTATCPLPGSRTDPAGRARVPPGAAPTARTPSSTRVPTVPVSRPCTLPGAITRGPGHAAPQPPARHPAAGRSLTNVGKGPKGLSWPRHRMFPVEPRLHDSNLPIVRERSPGAGTHAGADNVLRERRRPRRPEQSTPPQHPGTGGGREDRRRSRGIRRPVPPRPVTGATSRHFRRNTGSARSRRTARAAGPWAFRLGRGLATPRSAAISP